MGNIKTSSNLKKFLCLYELLWFNANLHLLLASSKSVFIEIHKGRQFCRKYISWTTICCVVYILYLFERGDITINQFFSSSIWLCCLIIRIDKTWSNLSNHDLIFFFFLFIQQNREGWVQESKLMGDSYRGAASLWVCNSVLHLFFQYHSHFTQTNAYWNSQCHSILQSMYTSRLLEKTQIIARPTQLQLLNLQCNVCLCSRFHSILKSSISNIMKLDDDHLISFC